MENSANNTLLKLERALIQQVGLIVIILIIGSVFTFKCLPYGFWQSSLIFTFALIPFICSLVTAHHMRIAKNKANLPFQNTKVYSAREVNYSLTRKKRYSASYQVFVVVEGRLYRRTPAVYHYDEVQGLLKSREVQVIVHGEYVYIK